MKLSQLNVLTLGYVLATATRMTMAGYAPRGLADGYVDVRQWMENREPNFPADANIALEKRDRSVARGDTSGQAVEARQTADQLADEAQDDAAHRAEYTQEVVTILHNFKPHYNYVICHVPHTFSFDGIEGKDWGTFHQDLAMELSEAGFPSTIRYDIYWFSGTGTFTRQGDGGFINWAYWGNVKSTTQVNGGEQVVFNKP